MLKHVCLLQVLERWCTSPRTIEVLMNTYSHMQLPEEAIGLVPPETLQVRFQDTITQPASRDSHLLEALLIPQLCLTEMTQRPSQVPKENSQSKHPKHTSYS